MALSLSLDPNESACRTAWDNSLDQLWVAVNNKLRRYDANGQMTFEMANPAGVTNTYFLKPDGQGGIWLGTETQFVYIDPTGAVGAWITPFSDFTEPAWAQFVREAVVRPADASIWIANEMLLRRYSTAGAELAERSLEFPDHIGRYLQNMDVFEDLTPPTLAFAAPPDESSTNVVQPTLRLNYLDAGSGVDAATLTFTVNGAPLAVTCTSTSTSADCTPDAPLANGVKNVSATVADRDGNASEEATVSFTVDTLAPQITVTSPLQDAFVNVAAQSISGSLNEAATLTMNGQNVTVNGSQAFTASATLTEGLNSFVFVATDAAGNSASITRRLTLDTAAPAAPIASQISVSIGAGVLTINGSAGASEPGTTVVITNLRTGGSVAVIAQASGAFTAQLAGQAGDSLQVRAVDLAGNMGGVITVSTGAATLVLSVAAPVDGGTVADRRVLVTGSVSGGENIGVAINRRAVATTVDGAATSFASLVALLPGANSIEIVATDTEGHTSSRSITVTRTAQTPYSATVSPEHGIAPLAAAFDVSRYSQTSPAQIEVDFDGDGEFDAVSDSIDTPVTFTYETAGAFLARVRVTEPDDTEYEYVLPIVVKSSAQIDAEARATLTRFSNALGAGDAAAALQLMTGPAAQRFSSVFAILGTDLPEIAATISPPQSVTIMTGYAEYAVTREIAGVQRVFLVGLLREADGIWRIDSL